jgi:hypothetical protein
MNDLKMVTSRPLPIPATELFMKAFNSAVGNPTESVQKALENKFKLAYTAAALARSYMLW